MIPLLADNDLPAIETADRQVTYRRLGRLVREHASLLNETLGGRPETIALHLSDSVELVAMTLAALSTGCRALLLPPETPHVAAGWPGVSTVFTDTDSGAGVRALPFPEQQPDGAPTPAVLFLTSGTTGQPKPAIHPLDALAVEASAISRHLGYGPGKRVLCPVPLCHAYGFMLGGLAAVLSGATLIAERPLTHRQFAACLEARSPHVVIAVPQLYDMWARGRPHSRPAGTLELCVSSGAPLPGATAARFAEVWGTPIAEQYGSSECGAVTINLEHWPEPGCVGRPYPGVQVTAGSRDAPGPITVRSQHAGTPRAHPVSTGDIGWTDEQGRLHVTGRRADLVSVHGRKVDPREVETALLRCAGVREAIVLGMDADNGDQWLAAFIVCADRLDEKYLANWCTTELAAWQVPRRFFGIDAVPRTATGKPKTAALRELAWSRLRGEHPDQVSLDHG